VRAIKRGVALLAGACLLLAAASTARPAPARSKNFTVTAPTDEVAQSVARAAESARERVAVELTGQALADWPTPCPITVQSAQGSGGATTFGFSRGQLPSMQMNVQGTADKIVNSVVPHEVTHAVLADLFRRPVPRWADEGLAVCAEPAEERARHDKICRDILNDGKRRIPLARLVSLGEYPSDVMALYAEGYSVTSYLVGQGGPRRFVQFLGQGMGSAGWDRALQANYGVKDTTELERNWLEHLRATKGQPAVVGLGGGTVPAGSGGASVAPGPARPASQSDPTAAEMMALLREIRDDQKSQRSEISDLRGRVEALERANPVPAARPPSAPPPAWNDRPQGVPALPPAAPGMFAQPFPAGPANCPPGRQ
jgi:lysophospholipase L1-like esterase